MSALSKPDYDSVEQMPAAHSRISPSPRPLTPIEPLVAPPTPLWLNLLKVLQRYSSPVAWVCVVAVIPFYGFTVATQRDWSQRYQELQHLQRQEQQLAAVQATHRSQVAEESLQNQRLVPQVPANSLFLRTAPVRTVATVVPPAKPALPASAAKPLSY